MSKPAIVTEYRFDTERYSGVFHAKPNPTVPGSYTVEVFPSTGSGGGTITMSSADLACAAEFFARLAAESSKEPA